MVRVGVVALALCLMAATASAQAVWQIKPSQADPRVRHYDDLSLVFDTDAPPGAPLVVFLPGTGGEPEKSRDFLTVVAGQGYRVIGLEYDDAPAVSQTCPRDPDPDCSTNFRRMRVYGEGQARVSNPPEESIVTRLVMLLQMLNQRHPRAGWDQYLDGDRPRWDRIVVSGLSQGAGMAAFIARKHEVARVVLFSSPWDSTGRDSHPAPWLSEPSATPMDRWFAEYHKRENTAGLIRNAYAALQIPADHVRVFDADLPPGKHDGDNPFHGSTIRNMAYADQWRAMFGTPSDDSAPVQ